MNRASQIEACADEIVTLDARGDVVLAEQGRASLDDLLGLTGSNSTLAERRKVALEAARARRS